MSTPFNVLEFLMQKYIKQGNFNALNRFIANKGLEWNSQIACEYLHYSNDYSKLLQLEFPRTSLFHFTLAEKLLLGGTANHRLIRQELQSEHSVGLLALRLAGELLQITKNSRQPQTEMTRDESIRLNMLSNLSIVPSDPFSQIEKTLNCIQSVQIDNTFWKHSKAFHLALSHSLKAVNSYADFLDCSKLVYQFMTESDRNRQFLTSLLPVLETNRIRTLLQSAQSIDPRVLSLEINAIMTAKLSSFLLNDPDMDRLIALLLHSRHFEESRRSAFDIFTILSKALACGFVPAIETYQSVLQEMIKENVDSKHCILLFDYQKTHHNQLTSSDFAIFFSSLKDCPLTQIINAEKEMTDIYHQNHTKESLLAIIMILLQNGYFEDAFQRFGDMKLINMPRSLDIYNKIFSACSNDYNASQFVVKDFYYTFLREKFIMDDHTTQSLLACAITAKEYVFATQLLGKISNPNGKVIDLVIALKSCKDAVVADIAQNFLEQSNVKLT
jgi:hypothetical protein